MLKKKLETKKKAPTKMLVTSCHITIGKYAFEYCHKLTITQNLDVMTSTAKIELPRNLKYQNTPVKSLFKKGDRVEIELGYNGIIKSVFWGIIVNIGADIPIVIECADAMQLLKQTPVKAFSYKQGQQLESVIKQILPGSFKASIASHALGKLKFGDTTVFEVLKRLKKQYNLVCYLDRNLLRINTAPTPEIYVFDLRRNVIKNNLEYVLANDVRIKVKAISVDKNNERIEVVVGDNDGELRTVHFMNLTKSELEKQADLKLRLFKYDGYKGYIKTFGEPNVLRGDTVDIVDAEYPQRGGKYFVEKVDVLFGVNGYQRKIYLGKKVA